MLPVEQLQRGVRAEGWALWSTYVERKLRLHMTKTRRRRSTAGPEEMRRFVGPGPILTDDLPLLEYHRSLRNGGRAVDLSSLRGDVTRLLQP
jgi:hypothetical protein